MRAFEEAATSFFLSVVPAAKVAMGRTEADAMHSCRTATEMTVSSLGPKNTGIEQQSTTFLLISQCFAER
jgi:hypothetical protein